MAHDKYSLDRFKAVAKALAEAAEAEQDNAKRTEILGRLKDLAVVNKEPTSIINSWFTVTGDRNLNEAIARLSDLNANKIPRSFFARLIRSPFATLLTGLEYRLLSLKANYHGVYGPTIFSRLINFLAKPFQKADEPELVPQDKIIDAQKQEVLDQKPMAQAPEAPEDPIQKLVSVIDKGDMETLKVLIEYGANMDDVITWIIREKRVDIIPMLVRNLYPKIKDNQIPGLDVDNGLLCCILLGNLNIVKNLVEQHQANIDHPKYEKYGNTPLGLAVSIGNAKIVEFLLENKAEMMNSTLGSRHAPFIQAIEKGNSEIIKLFLKTGADPNQPDPEGKTPLMLTIENGWVNGLKVILSEVKTNLINLKDTNDQTPLMLAAEYGSVEVVKLLLENKAEISYKNNKGETALMLAAKNGNIEIVHLLLEQGATIGSEIRLLTSIIFNSIWRMDPESIDLKLIQSIITAGKENNLINLEDNLGQTPLMVAAEGGEAQMRNV